jgi:predicted nucleotidyltransferase
MLRPRAAQKGTIDIEKDQGFALRSGHVFQYTFVAHWFLEPYMATGHAIFEPSSLKAPAAGNPILTELVRRLVEAYSPLRIYLFGSMARGDGGPDSDFDLMVIVPDNAHPEMQRSRLAYRALRGTGTAVDVVVWPKSSFERRSRVPTSLPATVAREGVLIYGAGSGTGGGDARLDGQGGT